jgi:hypothetical protein
MSKRLEASSPSQRKWQAELYGVAESHTLIIPFVESELPLETKRENVTFKVLTL